MAHRIQLRKPYLSRNGFNDTKQNCLRQNLITWLSILKMTINKNFKK